MLDFVNAQEMAKMYSTFEAPTIEELNALTVGKSVKVCHNDERFWVTITAIDEDTITGTVDNDLIRHQPFKYKDTIQFKKHNIYNIF